MWEGRATKSDSLEREKALGVGVFVHLWEWFRPSASPEKATRKLAGLQMRSTKREGVYLGGKLFGRLGNNGAVRCGLDKIQPRVRDGLEIPTSAIASWAFSIIGEG